MKKILAIGLVVAVAVILTSCATKFTNRYAPASIALTKGVAGIPTPVEFSVFAMPPKPSITKTKSVYDLSPEGQRAYVDSLRRLLVAKNDPDPEKLIALLSAGIKTKPKLSVIKDQSSFTRRLVLNLVHRPVTATKVRKNARFNPADRVVWAEMKVTLPPGFRFVGYDKIDTGYETVDLGKLTRSVNWSLTGSVGGEGSTTSNTSDVDFQKAVDEAAGTEATSTITDGSTIVSKLTPSVSGTVGETLGEEVQLKNRYVTFAVYISDDGSEMTVIRQGAVGIDLTGTLVIDAAIKSDRVVPIDAYTFKPGATLGMTRISYILPSKAETVPVTISGSAWVRHSRCGAYSVAEGDDHVTFKEVVPPVRTIDIDLSALRRYYGFQSLEDPANNGWDVVHVVDNTNTPRIVRFSDYTNAGKFWNWLCGADANAIAKFKTDTGLGLVLGGGSPVTPTPAGSDCKFALDTL